MKNIFRETGRGTVALAKSLVLDTVVPEIAELVDQLAEEDAMERRIDELSEDTRRRMVERFGVKEANMRLRVVRRQIREFKRENGNARNDLKRMLGEFAQLVNAVREGENNDGVM